MEAYIKSIAAISPQHTFTDGVMNELVTTQRNRLNCIEPDYKEYIDANLRRRMSRIIKMGVTAAIKCIKQSNDTRPGAIITATGLGCLADTENFINSVLDNNESLTSPTAFIQSTFNTVGAQIALMLKNQNYNFTYVHRGFSLESALLDGMMQISDNEANDVLVGAVDELTDTSYSIMQRMGFWKTNLTNSAEVFNSNTRGSLAGEGATFFMLSKTPGKTSTQLAGISTLYKPQSNKEVNDWIASFLQSQQVQLNDIDLLLPGNSGDYGLDAPYRYISSNALKGLPQANFKHLCGEYHTAAAFALWMAAKVLSDGTNSIPALLPKNFDKSGRLNTVLIYNHYRNINHSLMLVRK